MEGLTFRKATPEDAERVAEIVAGDPGREAIGIARDVDRARAMGIVIARMEGMPAGRGGLDHTTLAELHGEAVGIVHASSGTGRFKVTPAVALAAIRIFGPLGAVRLLPRVRARARVDTPSPAGALHIGELDVDPRYRNRGIGGALLSHVEAEAREQGCRLMSLTTHMANPARRLYERHGFRVVETRTDPDYERYTGIEGRVLMVKELG
ncbi:MAG: GNAT family N-acetyltransferase [Dehalococcoidia bacterium]|nr:GNAT family N-acetyltransferase [Dehalococcoidia bacterium]